MGVIRELSNQVAARRRTRGMSQSQLAEAIGTSRQALSAIEAGRAVPSTAIALRLARALSCSVESLFRLEESDEVEVELPTDVTSATPATAASGRAWLGRVGGRWVAHPLPAERVDAAADGELLQRGGRSYARLFEDPSAASRRLLVAGCDPALGVLAASAARAGLQVRWLPQTSEAALRTVSEGRAHVAGAHLYDPERDEHNLPFVRRALPGRACVLVQLASTEEGWLLAPGNPLGFRDATDLTRPGVRLVERPAGAAAAALLQRQLARAGVAHVEPAARAQRPQDVGRAIAKGHADVGISTLVVARAHGLDFLPLHAERFDLVFEAGSLDAEPVARLLDVLAGRPFLRQLGAIGGYDVTGTGSQVGRTRGART